MLSSGSLTMPGPAPGAIRAGGVDLVDVVKFRRALHRYGSRLVTRVFDDREQARLTEARLTKAGLTEPVGRADELAATFSAKESVVKILGGLPAGARYVDVSVGAVRDGLASPVRLGGVLARWADDRGVELFAGASFLSAELTLTWALAFRTEATG